MEYSDFGLMRVVARSGSFSFTGAELGYNRCAMDLWGIGPSIYSHLLAFVVRNIYFTPRSIMISSSWSITDIRLIVAAVFISFDGRAFLSCPVVANRFGRWCSYEKRYHDGIFSEYQLHKCCPRIQSNTPNGNRKGPERQRRSNILLMLGAVCPSLGSLLHC